MGFWRFVLTAVWHRVRALIIVWTFTDANLLACVGVCVCGCGFGAFEQWGNYS